jgi:hypothetical protein
MVDLVKQSMAYIWATSGDIVAPDIAKIESGWAVETVPRQWWNWMQNRVDNNIAYLLQKGFPEWDAETEYIINKSYVQYQNVVYKCIQTHSNQEPNLAPLYWVKAFVNSTASGEALAGVTPATDALPYFTGSSSASTTTLTSFARTLLDDVDALAARTTLSAQAANIALTALSGVTPAANQLPYFTGASTAALTTLSAFGRSLMDDADATAARATMGLGSMAVQNSNSVSITGGSISGITDLAIADGGTGASDAAGARTNLGLGNAAVATTQANAYDTVAGRLALNNFMGWGSSGNMQELLTADSITNLNVTALYRVSEANALAAGAPVAADGIIAHYDFGPNNKSQVFHAVSGTENGLYTRRYATTWSAWVQGWHSGNQLALGTTAASGRTALGLANSATIVASVTSVANQIVQRNAAGGLFANSGNFIDNLAIGRTDNVASYPYIDFNAGATTVDYDARIVCETGNGSVGGGLLRALSDNVIFSTTNGLEVFTGATSRLRVTTSGVAVTGTLNVSGTVTAPTFVGNLNGTATSAVTVGTADKLTTPRTIAVSGAVNGSASFDGSANVTIATTPTDSGFLSPTLVNSYYDANALRYRKVGNVVTITGTIGRTAPPSTLQVMFTLPVGFRPSSIVGHTMIWGLETLGSLALQIRVDTNGQVSTGFTPALGGTISGNGNGVFGISFTV